MNRAKTIFFLYALLITFGSVKPSTGAGIDPWDKVIHLVMYAMFALFAYPLVKAYRGYIYICIAIVAYGGFLEVVQHFLPGRQMSLLDLLANTAGVLVGMVIATRTFYAKAGRESEA